MGLYKMIFVPLLLLCFLSETLYGQEYPEYQKEQYISKTDTLPYRILLPENYDPSIAYPLILFLHGSGERGSDNSLQLTHGADLFLKESIRKEFPAFVVFPQCPAEQSWSNRAYVPTDDGYAILYPKTIDHNAQQDLLKGLIGQLTTRYKLDENRLYAGGLSNGGMGTFELVHRNPNLFAAAFAICGGANPHIAEVISETPWWLFHGEADAIVPISGSKDMYRALKEQKADVTMTLYPEVGHDSWTNAFAEPELFPWLFSRQKNSE